MAAADLAAALAARQTEEKVRRAVLARFDFTGNMRDRVRRTEVYAVAAEVLSCAPNSWTLARPVKRIVIAAGGIPIYTNNVKRFARMRPRDRELIPGEHARTGKGGHHGGVGQLQRAWYSRLKAENLDLEPGGRLKELPHFRDYAADINQAFFEKATSEYWRRHGELQIEGLYVLEGLSIREIAAKTGKGLWEVQVVVKALRQRLNLTPDPGQETGADE